VACLSAAGKWNLKTNYACSAEDVEISDGGSTPPSSTTSILFHISLLKPIIYWRIKNYGIFLFSDIRLIRGISTQIGTFLGTLFYVTLFPVTIFLWPIGSILNNPLSNTEIQRNERLIKKLPFMRVMVYFYWSNPRVKNYGVFAINVQIPNRAPISVLALILYRSTYLE